jgi:hypothetical protein
MCILSVVWYVALKVVSENVYCDVISALGLMIAFYYGLTGFACAVFYRRELTRSLKNLVFMSLLPLIGGITLFGFGGKNAIDLADPANSYSGQDVFGVSVPLAITIGFLVLGVVLLILWWIRNPSYFRARPEGYRGDYVPADCSLQ